MTLRPSCSLDLSSPPSWQLVSLSPPAYTLASQRCQNSLATVQATTNSAIQRCSEIPGVLSTPCAFLPRFFPDSSGLCPSLLPLHAVKATLPFLPCDHQGHRAAMALTPPPCIWSTLASSLWSPLKGSPFCLPSPPWRPSLGALCLCLSVSPSPPMCAGAAQTPHRRGRAPLPFLQWHHVGNLSGPWELANTTHQASPKDPMASTQQLAVGCKLSQVTNHPGLPRPS